MAKLVETLGSCASIMHPLTFVITLSYAHPRGTLQTFTVIKIEETWERISRRLRDPLSLMFLFKVCIAQLMRRLSCKIIKFKYVLPLVSQKMV